MEFKGADFSSQQFDPPQGILLPFLYELQALVTNFCQWSRKEIFDICLWKWLVTSVGRVDTAVKQRAFRGNKGHITWFQPLLALLNVRRKQRCRKRGGRFLC